MARYTGPKRRLERRENATLFGSENWKKRQSAPGQHGASRGRLSAYAVQFREKQKVKRMYGVLEKQFRNMYEKAVKSKGNTGTVLLQLLELRLDNVVFKLGLAKTRMQSRQFVNHGHVLVNDKLVDIPSYICKAGDVIEFKPNFAKREISTLIKAELKGYKTPEWLSASAKGGEINAEPRREDIDRSINEQLIIELYSR